MLRVRESKSAPVGVVTKVLRILEALHASPTGLQLKDVARQTAIHKSTAYRFLAHLENEGYVFRDATGAYAIGVRLARLGSGVTYQATLTKISRPIIEQLWKKTTETINLAVMEGHEVLYIDVLESSHTFRLVSQVGARRPLNCTALGKAMLAYLPMQEQQALYPKINFERLTPHTIVKLAHLKKELGEVKARGYAMDNEEAYLGSRCFAAPIFEQGGKVVAAISVSGPTSRVTREKVPLFAGAVTLAARTISRHLGYSQPQQIVASAVSQTKPRVAAPNGVS